MSPHADPQIPLFDEIQHGETRLFATPKLPGFARDSSASRDAAIAIYPAVTRLQRRVLELFDQRTTWTVDEAQIALAIKKRNTIAPRFTELGPGTAEIPGLSLIHKTGARRGSCDVWARNR